MQAILITAYKDPEMLYRLLSRFGEGFRVFIHIDIRNKGSFDIKRLKENGNVEVYSKYAVTWGSIKHLYAILALMKRALKYDDVNYIHIISGQDYPVADISKAENDENVYLSIAPVPEERFRQYNVCSRLDQRKRTVEYIYRGAVRVQKICGINRKRLGSYENIYKGNIWSSMPRKAAEYAVSAALENNGAFIRDLFTTYIPEEFFFQTIFMNSTEWKDKVVKNNMRYNDWTPRDGIQSVPVVLDERDYDAIKASEKWFARKLDFVKSAGLLDKLDNKERILSGSLISVVITTCKRDMDILERAVKSALAQTWKDKEIIVVNDYPPYKEKIEELLKKYPEVRFISNEEQSGACVARNKGIEAAKGEFISPLDDDDEWLPEKLEKQMARMDDDTVMVYCNYSAFRGSEELKADPDRLYPQGNVIKDILASNFVGGCSVPLIKRDALISCGGFDDKFRSCQDLDVWIRLAESGQFKAVPEKLMKYSVGEESITGSFERRMQGWQDILEKYKELYEKFPDARREFCATIVREAAKRTSPDYSIRIFLKYGNVTEYFKGTAMKVLGIY